jgi:hypothetical protein
MYGLHLERIQDKILHEVDSSDIPQRLLKPKQDALKWPDFIMQYYKDGHNILPGNLSHSYHEMMNISGILSRDYVLYHLISLYEL